LVQVGTHTKHCPPPVTCLQDQRLLLCRDALGGWELRTFWVVKLKKIGLGFWHGVFALVMTARLAVLSTSSSSSRYPWTCRTELCGMDL
jgi:hypothetical protein